MNYDSDFLDDEHDRFEEHHLKHSVLGIASLVIVIVAALFVALLIAVAGVIDAKTPGGMDEESPIAIILGITMLGGMGLDLLGLGLGIAGLCQRHGNKAWSIVGVVIGALVLLGFFAIVGVGLLTDTG
jgi:hypothetical protein